MSALHARLLLALAGTVGLAWLAGGVIPDLPTRTAYALLINGLLLVVAFLRPYWGMLLVTFAMLLAPELVVGEAGARDITVRMDDLFVVCLALGWLGHCAVVREAPLFPDTPFTRPMGWYLAIGAVSSFQGMIYGGVDPLKSIFFQLKFAEYFLLMFLTLAIVRTERQARLLLWCGLVTALAVAWLGWQMHLRGEIVGTPFQRAGAEGATYGAYMILVMGLIAGVMLESGIPAKLIGGAILAAMFPPFMYTNSRASYMGLAIGSLALLAVARRGRGWIAPLIAAGAFTLIVHPPLQIKEKMESTFVGAGRTFFGYDVSADESVTERLWRYEMVLKRWIGQPLLGNGVGGPAVESIYITELSQTGVLGLGAFAFIAWRILRFGWTIRAGPYPPWVRGLGLGLVAGYVGLLGHAVTANTFHLIRVMEPLWLTVGLLQVLKKAAGKVTAAAGAEAVPALLPASLRQAGA